MNINALSSSAPMSMPNRFKFQGQEEQAEFDLNWIQFKWRNHDPATGRFFNIDPLAEEFYYNSPYAFSENKVTGHIELEGLEAVQSKNNEVNLPKVGRTLNFTPMSAESRAKMEAFQMLRERREKISTDLNKGGYTKNSGFTIHRKQNAALWNAVIENTGIDQNGNFEQRFANSENDFLTDIKDLIRTYANEDAVGDGIQEGIERITVASLNAYLKKNAKGKIGKAVAKEGFEKLLGRSVGLVFDMFDGQSTGHSDVQIQAEAEQKWNMYLFNLAKRLARKQEDEENE